jgi:hypothetical protein
MAPRYIWTLMHRCNEHNICAVQLEREGRMIWFLPVANLEVALYVFPWCRLWDPKPNYPYAWWNPRYRT